VTDRTSQPTTQVGPNPIYPASFIWNAAVPTVNSLNGAAPTSAVKGVDVVGTDGHYRKFTAAGGAMSFASTLPTSAYTLVIISAFPTPSVATGKLVSCPGSGGLRLECGTSTGGAYQNLTHSDAAAAVNHFADSAAFDGNKWIYIAAYTGTTLRQYHTTGAGAVQTMTSETISYLSPTGAQVDLGSPDGIDSQGIYAVMIVPSDIGDTECQALIANPWKMFAPVSTGITIAATIGNASATGTPATIASSVTIAATVGSASAAGVHATVTNAPAGVIIAAAVGNAAAAGVAANVGTYIQTDVIPNNTDTILANTAVVWTWTPAGRIGSMSGLTPVDGTGTTDAAGRLAPGIALAAGRLDVADRASSAGAKTDAVFYQAF
jgi:hypothetical protein